MKKRTLSFPVAAIALFVLNGGTVTLLKDVEAANSTGGTTLAYGESVVNVPADVTRDGGDDNHKIIAKKFVRVNKQKDSMCPCRFL